MRFGDHDLRVHLLNVSTTGALVHAALPPVRGTAVCIQIGSRAVDARIMWVEGNRFGVAFDRALDATLLESLLATAR